MPDAKVKFLVTVDASNAEAAFRQLSITMGNTAKIAEQKGKQAAAQWNIFESAITRAKWAAASFALSIASWRTFNFFRDATRDAIAFEKQLRVIQSISSGQTIDFKQLESDIDRIGRITGKMPLDIAVAVREAQSILNSTMEDAVGVAAEAARMSVAMNTDIGSAVTVLTRTIAAYGGQIKDVSEITEAFFDAVKIGGATAQQFAETWAKAIAPVAAIAGLGPQAAAGIFGTGERIWGAQNTATGMTSWLTKLYNPGDKQKNIYDMLGLDPLQKGDTVDQFIKTLETMRSAVKQGKMGWADFFDVRGIKIAIADLDEQFGLMVSTMKDTKDEVAAAMTAMQSTTQFQLEKAASNWAVYRKKVGQEISQFILPMIKQMNDYMDSGRGFWEGAGSVAFQGVRLGVTQFAADVAGPIWDIASNRHNVSNQTDKHTKAVALMKQWQEMPDKTIEQKQARAKVLAQARGAWDLYYDTTQSGTSILSDLWVGSARDLNAEKANEIAAEAKRKNDDYMFELTRLKNLQNGKNADGTDPGTPGTGTGTGGGGAPSRPSFDFQSALERGMVAVHPRDGWCLANQSALVGFLNKAGVPMAKGTSRSSLNSASELGRLAQSKGFTDISAAPIGSLMVFGNHVAMKTTDSMAVQNVGNKWVETKIGSNNLSAGRFKGYWPTLDVASVTGKSGGFYQPLTIEDLLAPGQRSYAAAGQWAQLSGLKYGNNSPQQMKWLQEEIARGQTSLGQMGAMGIPAYSEEYIRLQIELAEKQKALYSVEYGAALKGIDPSRAYIQTGVQRQLATDPYTQLSLGRKQLQMLDEQIAAAHELQITSLRGKGEEEQAKLQDEINAKLIYRKQLVEELDDLAASTAHHYEAQQTALAEAVTAADALKLAEQQRLDALANRMNDISDPRLRLLEFFGGIREANAGMVLSGKLPASRISGSNFNDPNLLGPGNGAELAMLGGLGLVSGVVPAGGEPPEEQAKKSKIGTMQYMQALGMLTQMTGMGGKTGGIGQVLSSYSSGVSMWSMLGGTGGGASMLGLGGGSIWGIAGVLLSGLGGLFKKDKVDYEKWLSKIAHNTAKMAEAYDTHYAAPPSALMPAPFAFAGMRGGF